MKKYYLFKTLDYYKEIKKVYNIQPLTKIWHKYGAPTSKSGKCVECFQKWKNLSDKKDMTFVDFGIYYLLNCKNIEDIYVLAEELKEKFEQHKNSFIDKENDILNIENIVDLIISHTVIDTYRCGYVEYEVENYLINHKKKVFRDTELDINYAIDLLIEKENFKYIGIQIKPISFFLGTREDIIFDKKKTFQKFKEVKEKYQNIDKCYFVIYLNEGDDFSYYYTQDNDIFHHFSNLDELTKQNWNAIRYNKNCWKKLI